MSTTRSVEYHSGSVSESANVVANDPVVAAPVQPPPEYRAPVVVRQNPHPDAERMTLLKKIVTITLVVISLLVIASGMFTKSGDKDTSAKIETVTAALYKMMQLLANNPQLLAINGVEGNQRPANDFASIDFHPIRGRNLSATRQDLQ